MAATLLIQAEPRRFGVLANQAYYCGACGDVYYKLRTGGRRWQLVYGCCSSCPPEADWWVPGSIWSRYPEVNAILTDAQVEWDFHLHLNWFETQWRKYDFPAP